jgi:purine-binding chemotaxis protein CheW
MQIKESVMNTDRSSEGIPVADDAIQFLTFCLEDNLLALPLDVVKEVIEVKPITALPRAPEYVRGLLNLRGQVIPVIDLRLKFSMNSTEFTEDTCIVIVEAELSDELVSIGALVDCVRGVLDVYEENREEAPTMGGCIENRYIEGMAREGENFLTLLSSQALFSMEALLEGEMVGKISARAQPVEVSCQTEH